MIIVVVIKRGETETERELRAERRERETRSEMEEEMRSLMRQGIDMCPSAGARGIGHGIHDAMVSVLQRASAAMQRAVLAFCWLVFLQKLDAQASFFF